MTLKDGFAAGGAGGLFALIADLLVNGGEFLLILVDQGPTVYVMLSYLTTAAPEVAWLPTAELEIALVGAALVSAVVYLVRAGRNTANQLDDNDE